jgi:hypothetical protein
LPCSSHDAEVVLGINRDLIPSLADVRAALRGTNPSCRLTGFQQLAAFFLSSFSKHGAMVETRKLVAILVAGVG